MTRISNNIFNFLLSETLLLGRSGLSQCEFVAVCFLNNLPPVVNQHIPFSDQYCVEGQQIGKGCTSPDRTMPSRFLQDTAFSKVQNEINGNEHSHCLWLLKFPYLLNVIHEVTAIHILHNKVQTILGNSIEKVSISVEATALLRMSLTSNNLKSVSTSKKAKDAEPPWNLLFYIIHLCIGT